MATEVLDRAAEYREKVEFLTDLFTCVPAAARVQIPPATAVLESGFAVRTHHPDGRGVATDVPIALGGTETAPSPEWLLGAAAASSLATGIAMRAAHVGVGLDELEVAVGGTTDVRGLLGIGEDVSAAPNGFTVVVKLGSDNATQGELWRIVRWAQDHSPVLTAIRNKPSVEVEITGGAR